MRRTGSSLVIFCFLVAAAGARSTATLQVGPGRALAKPSQAAAIAQNGDLIEIDAGLYTGDVAYWGASNLTIRGVGGRARLDAAGQSSQGKAIWVIDGANTVVENIEFFNATVPSQNGAGIRQQGAGLTIRNCYFHDNEDGILAGDNAASDILIENTEFARNGFGDGYTHNIYINHVRSFTLRASYIHHAKVGHNVKSRAYKNTIVYNRIMDEATGTSSYDIDLPNGGDSSIIGNLIQKGPNGSNRNLVVYAAEGASNPVQQLTCVNNTMVNENPAGGLFVNLFGSPTAVLTNNIFAGYGSAVSGNAQLTTNLVTMTAGFVNQGAYDYHLTSSSAAVNAGTAPAASLTPTLEYVHPLSSQARGVVGAIDIGAYEYGSASSGGGSTGGGSSGGGTGGGSSGGGGTTGGGGTSPSTGSGSGGGSNHACGMGAAGVLSRVAARLWVVAAVLLLLGSADWLRRPRRV